MGGFGDGTRPVHDADDLESLDALVRFSVDRGHWIAIIVVDQPREFVASDGSDGTTCLVGPESRVLRQDHSRFGSPLVVGQPIQLYPRTGPEGVILLQHAGGNWIPSSDEAAPLVERLARR